MAFKIELNADECIGCGACVASCGDFFEMDGDKAKVKKAETDDAGCASEAVDACPVNCIKVSEMQ
jgi:ferredoxin